MKKFLATILCFIMGCVALVGCAKEPEPAPAPTVEKKITYYAVIDGDKTSIPAGMYKKDGKYPTKYVVGKGADIDDLVEYIENDCKYAFGGWFADEALNTAFIMNDKDANGDVSVYAKITTTTTEVLSDIEYQHKLGTASAVMGHYTLLLDDTKTYPATYKEGEAVTIPNYVANKTVKENDKDMKYTFVGWFTDADCTVAFDGTIPATQTGKVTLYAKITIEDVTPPPAQEEEGAWTKNY